MKYENFTETQLIQESENVQNASNLLGILNSYYEAMQRLRSLLNLGSTDLAQHIVSKNFASKVNDLANGY